MDFSAFKNFYFMRCYYVEKHRDDFNSGELMYINSVKYFHDLENEFQQDFECGVFRQEPNTTAYLLRAKSNYSVDEAIDNVINNRLEDGEWVMKTADFKIYINGYILCLTIIPKHYIVFNENGIVFNQEHNISPAYWNLLNQYSKDKYLFSSVYDAETFMNIFYTEMTNKGYSVNYGLVEYENLDAEKRMKYSQSDISKLIFTKDEKYSYQNEFRLFIRQKDSNNTLDHIEVIGIDLRPSLIMSYAYLSPEYVKELKLTNKDNEE